MIVDSLTSQSPLSLASSALLLSLLYYVYVRLVREPSAYDQLPWAGIGKGRFGRLKTRFSLASRKDAIAKAWEEYSSKDKAFIWQQFLGRAMIVLPPSQLRWLLDQPHNVVSSHDFFNDHLGLETLMMDPKVHLQPLHVKVINNQLNRALGWTPTYILDELSRCFNENWGFSPDWHEETVWPSFMSFIARTANRMFIGEELCRNEEFTTAVLDYAKIFIMHGTLLRPFPQWIRTTFAFPMTLPIRRIFARILKHVGPVVEKRKADIERKLADPTFEYKEPNDLLQWIIHACYESSDPTDLDTARIAKRYMAINFAAIHTTTLNSTRLVVELVSTDPADDYMGQIRAQIADVYRECRGEWTKAALAKLTFLDSALREALRVSGGGGAWTPSRKVVAPNGLTLPNGMHVPRDAHLAISSYGLHHHRVAKSGGEKDTKSNSDDDDDAAQFRPLRWATQRDAMTGADEVLAQRNLQATATGLEYLPFGHGRDACPGRFFAVQEIKLMIVHMLLNYEIAPLGERPESVWYSDTPGAPVTAKINVRKISPPILD